MRKFISCILSIGLLFVFSSCKTGKDVTAQNANNTENKIVNTRKAPPILKDKTTLALSLGGLDFYIKALGCCNNNYSNPSVIVGSVGVKGILHGSAVSNFNLAGVPFPAGSTIEISNVTSSIPEKPVIKTDANLTKTITVNVRVGYTIIAKGGGRTSEATTYMTLPLSATIKQTLE